MMIVDLTNLDYYPTHVQLTSSSDLSGKGAKRFGIEFDIDPPITGSDEGKVLKWKLGLNMIKHKIAASDYYIKSGETFDASELDTLKVSRSNPSGESLEDYISFELIQIGRSNGFL